MANFERALRLYNNAAMIRKMSDRQSVYQFIPNVQDIIGCSFKTLLHCLHYYRVDAYYPRDPKPFVGRQSELHQLSRRDQFLMFSKYGHTDEARNLIAYGTSCVDWVCTF